MTARVRPPALGLAAVLAAATLAGCGSVEDRLDEVKEALRATREDATRFVYEDSRADRTVRVTGVVEDDFRFKALVTVDDQPAFEEVVRDDALALRFLEPTHLPSLVDRSRIDVADRSTELEGVDVIGVLGSRRWVVDHDGAPPVTSFGLVEADIGRDPVFDALTALDYVERALTQAVAVDEWRSDALNPTYPRTEDVFPRPEEGSGVTRYDLRRPFLPAAFDPQAAGGIGALPATRHFRKMAIYVKDGRVISVIERVEAIGKLVDDFREYVETLLEEARAERSDVREFERLLRTEAPERLGNALLGFLNVRLAQLGADPVLVRTMTLEFQRGGDPGEVALPTTDVVAGSLEVMLASGQSKLDTGLTEGGEGAGGEGPADGEDR